MSARPPKPPVKLRTGFTTGAGATATAVAAAGLLFGDASPPAPTTVTIQLPRGQRVEFAVHDCKLISPTRAIAHTIKDAGDDPDVTHRATIFTEIRLTNTTGIRFHAAAGVGTVTRAGLSLAVGEPAINPVPRTMLREHLHALAATAHYHGGIEVHVGVVDGERLARQTMNARLGILGGLSILGTSGIVRPFSCSAYIASIHQSIDVAHANGIHHIAAATGSRSEQFIQQRLALPAIAVVEMGDFVGAVLKHLRRVPMQQLSICGGFGKMCKLAAGQSSLHSREGAVDFDFIAAVARDLGAGTPLCAQIKTANTTRAALQYCQAQSLPLANRISHLARQTALSLAQHRLAIAVYCIDAEGRAVGCSRDAAMGADEMDAGDAGGEVRAAKLLHSAVLR